MRHKRLLIAIVLSLFGFNLSISANVAGLDQKMYLPLINTEARLQVTNYGQDGGIFAGSNCNQGSTSNDNLHIRVNNLKPNTVPIKFRIEESGNAGVWQTPCDPTSHWLIRSFQNTSTSYDLYFKPYRSSPSNTVYTLIVTYEDGTTQTAIFSGGANAGATATPIPTISPSLSVLYLGQDGTNYAGSNCNQGSTLNDNIHIRISGLKTNTSPIKFRIEESGNAGVWQTPCDPISNWLIQVFQNTLTSYDLYFKPYRNAPNNTLYLLVVTYDDGTTQSGLFLSRTN